MNFDTYKTMLTWDGETGRDRAISKIHRDIYRLAKDNPAYKDVLINGEERKLTIVSTQDPHTKAIKAMPTESLSVGNWVKYCDHDYWVTSCSVDDGIYAYGEMDLCNTTVRFRSVVDGSIQEYPTLVTNTTKFNTGETAYKRLVLGSGQFAMILPINEHTLKIENGWRFLIDRRLDYPSAYRVTYVDPATYGYDDGLLNIVLLQCDYNPDTDNIEEMIADYYPMPTEDSESSTIELYADNLYLRVGGSAKTFTPTITDDITTPLIFSVSMLDEVVSYVSYETTDTSITFQVEDERRLIGNIILLTITDADGGNEYSTNIVLKGLV